LTTPTKAADKDNNANAEWAREEGGNEKRLTPKSTFKLFRPSSLTL
jgi:hypothetical protein